MLTHVSLFSGIGAFDYAAERAGFKTVMLCEIDAYCQRILKHHWPGVPVIKDVKDVTKPVIRSIRKHQAKQAIANAERDGLPATAERGITRTAVAERDQRQPPSIIGQSEGGRCVPGSDRLTLLTASPPCQPVSCAGKRRGAADDRYLWPEVIRIVKESRPRWFCFENPTGFITMGLDGVLSDLEGTGYSCQTAIIPACAVNAPHRRDRLWIVGHANSGRCQQCDQRQRGVSIIDPPNQPTATDTDRWGCESDPSIKRDTESSHVNPCSRSIGGPRNSEPRFRPLDDGAAEGLAGLPDWCGGDWQMPPPLAVKPPERVNRIKALGNSLVWGQVYPILKAIADYESGLTHNKPI